MSGSQCAEAVMVLDLLMVMLLLFLWKGSCLWVNQCCAPRMPWLLQVVPLHLGDKSGSLRRSDFLLRHQPGVDMATNSNEESFMCAKLVASGFADESRRGNTKLKELMLESDNRICADCSQPDPKWASANIGVFICLKCCGVHRSLGTHISKVLSVTLDEWSDEEIESMVEVGGNSYANAIYEAFLPQGYSKPGPDASTEERTSFIRSKYELQEFLKPSLRIVSNKSFRHIDSSKTDSSIRSNSSKSDAGMVEFIGILKVKVIKGTDLAVRDMLTSDPYVVLTLGQQRVQTTVIKSNLNPIWNEELKLSVPQRFRPMKLEVYDHDTFSADDIMGDAEIDIQPLITAAMAFGDATLLDNMQIGKWLKTRDNALIHDSIINIVDGKVKQKMSLKLQNVESGELDLELEWLPLDQ